MGLDGSFWRYGHLAPYLWAPWRSYEKYLPKPEMYAEIQGVVSNDRMVDDDSLSDLAKSKNIEINIAQLRLSRHEPWNECRGKILVLKPVIPLKYGMSVLVKGALVLPGKMRFQAYLITEIT